MAIARAGDEVSARPILTAAETRAAEDAVFATGVTVEELMERAGQAVAEAVWRYAGAAPTLVVCGPGNNGGDGYVIARALADKGVKVRVAASGDPRTDTAQAMRARWTGPVEALADANPAPILVDALFGTGLARPLDGAVAGPLDRLAKAARQRIAVDLPSGVGTDDGALLGATIDYEMTVALGNLKPAHRLQPAVAMMGRIVVADIGLDATSALTEIARPYQPAPGASDHKYTRGLVVVAEGAMTGAAMLSAMAAQRAGAGYVVLAGEGQGGPAAMVRRRDPLATVLADERVGAVVVGPGLGRTNAGGLLLDAALASGRRLVIDADALVLLVERGFPLAGMPILTPHEGEFAKLFGDLPGTRIDRARAAAVTAQAVVVLKGPDTVVAAPDGRAAVSPPAPAWLASAGTGDVLAGAIGACLARGFDPFEAAQAGAWLQAEAARIAGPGLIADDLIPALTSALVSCG